MRDQAEGRDDGSRHSRVHISGGPGGVGISGNAEKISAFRLRLQSGFVWSSHRQAIQPAATTEKNENFIPRNKDPASLPL